jgi:hypothetical protein
MRVPAGLVLTGSILLSGVHPATAEVRLAIQNGRVTLVATEATLGEILDEWERVGQTRIINRDRVSRMPMTLELTDVPESQALGILLRSVNGYIAAPRAIAMDGLSRFDRVMIMPGTPAPRVRSNAAPAFTSAPEIEPAPFAMPPFEMPPDQVDVPEPVEERPVRTVPPPATPGAVFGAFPRPQVAQQPEDAPPRDPRAPAPAGSTPTGVAVPGMIVPGPPSDREPAQGR